MTLVWNQKSKCEGSSKSASSETALWAETERDDTASINSLPDSSHPNPRSLIAIPIMKYQSQLLPHILHQHMFCPAKLSKIASLTRDGAGKKLWSISIWIRSEFGVSVIDGLAPLRTEMTDLENPIISVDLAFSHSLWRTFIEKQFNKLTCSNEQKQMAENANGAAKSGVKWTTEKY